MTYTNENLFDVIRMIASNEMSKLNFDVTIVCTIADNSRANFGWYTVTDGQVRFDAYSEDTKLKIKDSVRVQVPQGDMSGRKYILGKAAAENTNTPVSYISPSERIVDLTSNLYPATTQEVKLLANSQITEVTGDNFDVSSHNVDTNIYDTINLGFDVKTQFINTSINKGNYGVTLAVAYEPKFQLEGTSKQYEYRYYALDSQDFLGNPYSFLMTERQEVLFKIGLSDHRVAQIQLRCYQKDNFTYPNPFDSGDVRINSNPNPAEGFYDITLSNFYVSFGNELSKVEDNTVKISTFNDVVYEIGEESAKPKCNVTWYNKDENNKYIGFSDGRPVINSENEIDATNAYSELEYLDKYSIYTLQYNLCAFGENEAGTTIELPLDENGLFLKDNMIKVDKDIVVLHNGIDSIETEQKNIVSAVAVELQPYINKAKTDLEELKTKYRQLLFGTTESIYYDGFVKILLEANKKCQGKTYSIPEYFNPKNAKDIATQVVTYAEDLRIDLNALKGHTSTDEDVIVVLNKFKTAIADTLSKMIESINALTTSDFLTSLAEDNSSLNSSLMATQYFDANYLYIDYEEYAANRYNIYWYRANTQEIAPDPFGGSGWTRIPELDNKGLPEGKDYTRLGIDAFYTKLPSNIKDKYAEFEFTDGYATQEKVKAVIVYNHNYYSSNILEFENKSPIVDKTVLLSIQHGNFSQDMFQIYSDDYQIVNTLDASRDRELKLKVNQEDFDWLGATVTWTIPKEQTQLVRCDEEMSKKGYTQENNENNPFVIYSLKINSDSHYKENEEGKKVLDDQFITFIYNVSGHFSPRNVNNTITCAVALPNGEAVTAEKTLNFTAFGTNGSKYNLFFEPLNGYQYPILPFTNSSDERVLTIAPRLYDADGNEVSFNADAIEIKDIDDNDVTFTIDENSGNITFQLLKEVREYYLVPSISIIVSVLPADSTQTTDPYIQVKLTKQYPIAIGYYYQYEGISKVVYSVLGSDPKYYSKNCYLYDMGTNQRETYSCELKDLEENSNDTSLKLITTTNNEYYVKAAEMYIKAAKPPKWVLLFKDQWGGIIFCQPIPIMQDNFTSKLLNDWDGGTEVGKDVIMSNLIGAGSKNAKGEFSGVLMGEVQRAYEGQSMKLEHGLFGYQKNNLNFQLTTDGVLKLGNNTSGGQIIFDGTNGVIQSNNYEQDKKGMKIDLSEGIVDSYNFRLTSKNIRINTDHYKGSYFSIIDDSWGEIFAVRGGSKSGIEMAGWKIDNNSIRFGTLGNKESMWLSSVGTNTEANIGNSGNISGWNITCGPNFGVNRDGNVYLTGKITATSGKIGDWEITESRYITEKRIGDYLLSIKDGEDNKQFGVMLAPKDIVPQGGSMPLEETDQWKSWVIAAGEITKLTTDGKGNYCFDKCSFRVDGEGNMYASKGEIGGWKIEPNKLNSIKQAANKEPILSFDGATGEIISFAKNTDKWTNEMITVENVPGFSLNSDGKLTVIESEIYDLTISKQINVQGNANVAGSLIISTNTLSQEMIKDGYSSGTLYFQGAGSGGIIKSDGGVSIETFIGDQSKSGLFKFHEYNGNLQNSISIYNNGSVAELIITESQVKVELTKPGNTGTETKEVILAKW